MRARALRPFTVPTRRAFTPRFVSSSSVNPRAPLLDEYNPRQPLPKLDITGEPIPKPPHTPNPSFNRLTRTVRHRNVPPAETVQSEPAEENSSEAVETEVDADKDSEELISMTKLETSIRRNMAKYSDALVLTQVGSFFESYFDQAPITANILNLKLTNKPFGTGQNKVRHAMMGFPVNQVRKHVSTLVEAGHKVVLVEEYKQLVGKAQEVVIKRSVTRIITPGTGIDEAFVKSDESAFILGLGIENSTTNTIGMAYRDISTGDSFLRTTTLDKLRDDVLLIEPKEVVVASDLTSSELGAKIWEILKGEEDREDIMISTVKPTKPTTPNTLKSAEEIAENVLLDYIAQILPSSPAPKLETRHVDPTKILQMDSTTLKSLELREGLRGGPKGSLLSAIRRTSTPGGARLLADRICAPSTELNVINNRLSLVASLHKVYHSSRYMAALLKTLDDTPRILQRLFLRRSSNSSGFDLLSLKRTIEAVNEIRRILSESLIHLNEPDAFESVLHKLGDHIELGQAINEAIDETGLIERSEKLALREEIRSSHGERAVELIEENEKQDGIWGKPEEFVIRPNFSSELGRLHEKLISLRRDADRLEQELSRDYGELNLSLRVVPKTGAIVHVTRKTAGKLDADNSVAVINKSGSTRTYTVPAWSALHAAITKVTSEIQKLEMVEIKCLVTRVLHDFNHLQCTASTLSELDVALSFADFALEMNLVRPRINESTLLNIVAGRHPTVEHALKLHNRAFTPNNVNFAHPNNFVHILTGPNMAGKSTFLRQTALIVILAQAGSFVPAESAELGIVDKVFSRVGARDELDRDKSTFMIEMEEATSILKNATKNSLVLLDELGRGTSPLDGLAVAYAALEYLVHVNQSRTLFATHFHRLGELISQGGEHDWAGVEFWCTDVERAGDHVTYSHTLRRGLNDDSAGLIIAELSGMPSRALKVATDLRNRFR